MRIKVEANKIYKNMCMQALPTPILLEKRNCGAADSKWNEDSMWELLNTELHLLTKQNNKVSLMHQDFRECLAALHLVNDLYFFDVPESWDTELISDNILKFIAEIHEIRFQIKTVYKRIDQLRNKDMSNRYLLKNLIRLISKKQFDDLSTIDFSDLDLREVKLCNYIFMKGSRKSNFKRAKISEKTFLQEYHKQMITSIVYSFDGALYASSSYD